ncbi:MAG TPA: hypothetical protein VGK50_08280 [Coriobacteriia bacterium]|jgi:hypothetical protein
MPLVRKKETGPAGAAAPGVSRQDASSVRQRIPERRLLQVLVPVMVATVLAALFVNWRLGPPLLNLAPAQRLTLATQYEPQLYQPTKKPLQQLPDQILTYETMARQGVPGQTDRAAEALYNTLNVNLEMQVSISVYARAEFFPAESDAKVKQAQIMAGFPVKATTILVGGVRPAREGFNADQSAYAVTWINGGYLTFIKAGFKDHPPEEKRDFLHNLAAPVLAAVDMYQRTGKEGIQLGAEAAQRQPVMPNAPKRGNQPTTAPPAIDRPGGLGF